MSPALSRMQSKHIFAFCGFQRYVLYGVRAHLVHAAGKFYVHDSPLI